MPLGPHILWPETATKSTPSACTSSFMCGAACAASQTKIAPCSCAHGDELVERVDRPERVRDEAGRDDPDVPLARDRVEAGEVELAVLVERQEAQLGARLPRDVLPRDEVRVVLELGDDDEVARLEVPEPPRVRDEVDRLGRVADEDDLARRRRVEEGARALARVLEALGRALGELVDAAMDVRVRRLVEVVHRLEHLARLLRARGRIEEGERLAVELLLEDREIRAQRPRVKLRSVSLRPRDHGKRAHIASLICSGHSETWRWPEAAQHHGSSGLARGRAARRRSSRRARCSSSASRSSARRSTRPATRRGRPSRSPRRSRSSAPSSGASREGGQIAPAVQPPPVATSTS